MPRRHLLTTVLPALLVAGALAFPTGATLPPTAVVVASAVDPVTQPVTADAATRAAASQGAATADSPGTAGSSGTVDASGTPTVDAAAVLAGVDAAASTAGGTIAVVVLDADGTTLVTSAGTDVEYTASLVKLLVVQQ